MPFTFLFTNMKSHWMCWRWVINWNVYVPKEYNFLKVKYSCCYFTHNNFCLSKSLYSLMEEVSLPDYIINIDCFEMVCCREYIYCDSSNKSWKGPAQETNVELRSSSQILLLWIWLNSSFMCEHDANMHICTSHKMLQDRKTVQARS